jgi:hypothetical protein
LQPAAWTRLASRAFVEVPFIRFDFLSVERLRRFPTGIILAAKRHKIRKRVPLDFGGLSG